jgi:hypothetical protein
MESVVRWWWRLARGSERRGVRSTGGARGGVGGAVPWPEVPVWVEALLDGNSGAGWLAAGFEQRTRFREERGDNGKLIDFKAGLDGGWSRRLSTRWPWKRWRSMAVAAWRLESTRTKATL